MNAILGIRIPIFLIKFYFCIFFYISNNVILLILGLLALIVLIILNIISFIGAQIIFINLNEYLKEQQNKEENGYQDTFVLDIINTILEFILFFLTILYYVIKNKETKKHDVRGKSLIPLDKKWQW